MHPAVISDIGEDKYIYIKCLASIEMQLSKILTRILKYR